MLKYTLKEIEIILFCLKMHRHCLHEQYADGYTDLGFSLKCHKIKFGYLDNFLKEKISAI